MKIKSLKLGMAVKVGPREEEFLRDSIYDMEFVNEDIIKIIDKKTNQETFTHRGNVVYWTRDEDVKVKPKAKAAVKI